MPAQSIGLILIDFVYGSEKKMSDVSSLINAYSLESVFFMLKWRKGVGVPQLGVTLCKEHRENVYKPPSGCIPNINCFPVEFLQLYTLLILSFA